MRKTIRETAVRLISKEEVDYFKEDKRVIEFITDELTRDISERLIQSLEASGEIIVKKPVSRVSEYPHTDYFEYRKTVDWEPLVRCKDCKYYCEAERMCNDTNGFDRYWKPTDFCSYGERREDVEKLIDRIRHRRFCRLNRFYCPDCIYRDFVFDGTVFRGNRCRYGERRDKG